MIEFFSNRKKTKPPFNPQPLEVVNIEGNRITATDGTSTRIRDKNQLKRVSVRPPHLTLTSQTNQHRGRRSRKLILDNDNRTDVFPDITSERESPLFTLQPETALNMQQLVDNSVDNSADLPTSTPQIPDGQGVSNFVLDPEMAEGMQRLLDQAS